MFCCISVGQISRIIAVELLYCCTKAKYCVTVFCIIKVICTPIVANDGDPAVLMQYIEVIPVRTTADIDRHFVR